MRCFTKEDIDYAAKRLGVSHEEAVRILNEWDRGSGDVDDVIDEYEDAPNY